MENSPSISNFVLASLVSSYPNEEFRHNVDCLLDDSSLSIPSDLRSSLEDHCRTEAGVDEMRSIYIEIFDHSKSLNPLYETEYGRARAMFKAKELSDIAAFYRAFGFDLTCEGQKEMLDHISVELEFYSLMKMKLECLREEGNNDGIEIVSDGIKKFLNDHLGRFTHAITLRPGVYENKFYSSVFKWIDEMIRRECELFDVTPERINWLSQEQEEGAITCGGEVCFK